MSTVKSALDVGDKAPDFNLPSNRGEVSMSGSLPSGGVVLYFIREFGCMTCQFHASTLVKTYDQIRSAGFEVLVIGGGDFPEAVKMAARIKAPFPILADRDRSTYERYSVDKALAFIQRSATFVIDRAGNIAYAHRSTNPSGGLILQDVLAAVEAVRAKVSTA